MNSSNFFFFNHSRILSFVFSFSGFELVVSSSLYKRLLISLLGFSLLINSGLLIYLVRVVQEKLFLLVWFVTIDAHDGNYLGLVDIPNFWKTLVAVEPNGAEHGLEDVAKPFWNVE